MKCSTDLQQENVGTAFTKTKRLIIHSKTTKYLKPEISKPPLE